MPAADPSRKGSSEGEWLEATVFHRFERMHQTLVNVLPQCSAGGARVAVYGSIENCFVFGDGVRTSI